MSEIEEKSCPICLKDYDDNVIADGPAKHGFGKICRHSFCTECYKDMYKNWNNKDYNEIAFPSSMRSHRANNKCIRCPICRANIFHWISNDPRYQDNGSLELKIKHFKHFKENDIILLDLSVRMCKNA